MDVMSAQDIMAYRASLSKSQEYMLHSLRRRLREWVKLGNHGLAPEASEALDKIKLKKNESGVSIRTHDPIKGPYNEEEFQAITKYLLDNYAKGLIDLSDLSLGFLCMAFGARPVSFAALRLKDLVVTRDKHQIDQYTLRIPAAKRRGGGRRTHFHERKLTSEYGRMLQALVGQVKASFANKIETGIDIEALPLFPGDNPSFGYISSSYMLYYKMVACFATGDPIICNREGLEGQPLKVNPKRFRQTVGTRMAEENKREREIAQALGHVSMIAARVYVEATGKIRHSINEKLAQEVNPLAQYFLGNIVYSESDAIRGNDPSSRVRGFQGGLKGDVVGSCGKTGFCGGFVPLPCYECRSFQPWVDAPHEEVLAWLLHDRAQKYDATGDERIATVNDEIIKKVADVARRCRCLRNDAAGRLISS